MNLKNKKILIICNSFPNKDGKYSGGAFVKSQVIEIAKYFKEVNVISPIARSLKLESRDKYCQNYTINNIKVHYPRYFHLPTKQFRNKLGENQLKVIKKIIKKNKIQFDLIHGHHTWPGGFVAVKLKENYNKKAIITIHENRTFLLKELKEKNPKYIQTWTKADLIIRVNKIDVPALQKYNQNTITIPNGYEEQKFYKINKEKAKKKLTLPKNKQIMINIAHYNIKQKNQINLIKSIKEITKKKTDIRLYLIGMDTHNELHKINKLIEKLNLKEYIKATGPKPHHELIYWLNAADLFVLPSFSEGNPTVMFESLGCGLPYVGTNVGGVGEIITSDKYGLIYENPNDYNKLAQLIKTALNMKWNQNEILKYSKQFTWNKICKQIINNYDRLIK